MQLYSDTEKMTFDLEHVHDVSFQHVSTFQELIPQLHYEETSLLAFSMQQIRTDDITSIRQALLYQIPIVVPLPENPELLLHSTLRLDSLHVPIISLDKISEPYGDYLIGYTSIIKHLMG